MNFKYALYSFTFFIILITLTSCGNDDELTYPVTFTSDNIEFEDFSLFKLNETGQEEIAFTERLSAIEPIVREDIAIDVPDLPFNQITLISEDQILFLDTDQPADSFLIDYAQLSTTWLRAFFGENETEPFDLMLENSNSQLYFCIQSTVYFRQTSTNTNINGSLDYEFCDFSKSLDDVIDNMRLVNDLVAEDTVFHNRANIIFTRD